jgi:C4-dicarboxylate transporter DctQ subunit
MSGAKTSATGGWVNDLEVKLIALALGLMTVITFGNVVARYVFNSNILWALEATVFLFAWLVLLGVSHCVKISAHLGVDVVLMLLPQGPRRLLALVSVGCCIAFSVLLLIGAWQYWAPFAGKNVWYEVNDIPMPDFLQFLSDWLNEGERYEKIPRFIPYFALPLGMALMLLRFLQAAWRVWTGESEMVIASHEVEDALDEARPSAGGEGG